MEQRSERVLEAFNSTEISTCLPDSDHSKIPARTSRATSKQISERRINTRAADRTPSIAIRSLGAKVDARRRNLGYLPAVSPAIPISSRTTKPNRNLITKMVTAFSDRNVNQSTSQLQNASTVRTYLWQRPATDVAPRRFCSIILDVVDAEIIGGA